MNDAVQRYPANVFWSDEDCGFIATAPDLPGCSAFGESEAEAITELRDAIDAWIEAATAAGNPVPPPSRPSEDMQPSGKLLVRMPRSLHAALAQGAKRENVSLNYYVVYLLTSATAVRTIKREVGLLYGHWQSVVVGGTESGQRHMLAPNSSVQPMLLTASPVRELTANG